MTFTKLNMTRFQLKVIVTGAIVVAFSGYAIAKYGEYKIRQQIIAQCNKKAWPKVYDFENKRYCFRYFNEHGMEYQF